MAAACVTWLLGNISFVGYLLAADAPDRRRHMPVLVGDKLFATNESGRAYIFKAS